MSMRLAKNNTAPFDYYSEGDNSDPISTAVILDGSGVPATITGNSTNTIFVIFSNDGTYIDNISDAEINILSEETGIDWEISEDQITWGNTISFPTQDVSSADVVIQIYARANVINDGSIPVNNYIAAKIQTSCTQNPV